MATASLARRRIAPFLTWRPGERGAIVGVVTLIYVGVLALSILSLLSSPRFSLGLTTPAPRGVRVAWVLPGGTLWAGGVRPGATVLTLDGRTPPPHAGTLWTGTRVVVRLQTGEPMAFDARTIQRGSTWPLLLLSPWFLLLGTLVVLRAPQRAVGRTAYALFAAAAFTFAFAPAVDGEELIAIVGEPIAVAALSIYFVRFFLLFPQTYGSSRLRVSTSVPALLSLGCNLAALEWPYLYPPTRLIGALVVLAYLLAGAGLVVRAFVTAREPGARGKLTIISVGTIASILPLVALYFVPLILGRPALVTPEHAIFALALLPASFAYAILRYHLFDARLFQRWLVHGLLLTALFALCVCAVSVRRWLPLGAFPEPRRTFALALLFVLLGGACFGPLYSRLWRYLDHHIFKDSYDYRASLQGLSQDISLVGDLDALGASLPDTLRRMMNLDFAVLLVRDAGVLSARGVTEGYDPAMLPDLASAAEDVRGAPRAVSLLYGYLTILFVPLHTHDAVAGHLCLGPKSNGEPFRDEDRALLATLSGHLAAIVRNAQLVDDLRAKVRALEAQRATLDTLNERLQGAREEERTSLAADIHDEPLQTALHLQRQLAVVAERDPALRPYVALGQTVVDQLRAVCTAMRPAALDDLGLAAALDMLAIEQSERGDVPIRLETDAALSDEMLAPEAAVVLYRAAQEAITNCLRHARPRTIWMSLVCYGDTVRLRVADDGVGFAVPDNWAPLAAEGHLGLAGLRARARQAGGQVTVSSDPDRGTVVQVELPLTADRAEAMV